MHKTRATGSRLGRSWYLGWAAGPAGAATWLLLVLLTEHPVCTPAECLWLLVVGFYATAFVAGWGLLVAVAAVTVRYLSAPAAARLRAALRFAAVSAWVLAIGSPFTLLL